MRITIYADVTFIDENFPDYRTHGYRTHIITLSNKEAAEKLIEHFQAGALDNAGLGLDDFLMYDPILD